MENELLSVIVSLYNSEKYLDKSIQSILASTYNNLEILLVDDGSSDNSLQICEKYSKLDNRIKVFHKEHSGLTLTRNYGLERITGRYVTFTDSDDYISPVMYERLIDIINKEDVLIAKCNWIEIDESTGAEHIGKLKRYGRIPMSKAVVGIIEDSRSFGAGYLAMSVLDYKKICEISGSKFSFYPNMNYFDDIYFQTSIFLKIRKKGYIYVTEDCLYYYVMHKNSLSRANKTIEDELKVISDHYKPVELIKKESSIWNYRWAMGCHLNQKINLIYHNRNANRKEIWQLWNGVKYFFDGFKMRIFSWRFPAYYYKFLMICIAKVKYLHGKKTHS